MKPTIRTGGLFRCCIDYLCKVIESSSTQTSTTCPHCQAGLKLEGDVWMWDGKAKELK